MADKIIEARVWQKVDTEANWLANPLPLGSGEQAFVSDKNNFKVNTFPIKKTFAELEYYYKGDILGGVLPTDDLSSKPDGVYRATISGTYGGVVVKEGYYTLLRKKEGVWSLESEVKIPMQDLTEIEELIKRNNIFKSDFEERQYIEKAIKYIIVTEQRDFDFQLLSLVRNDNNSYEIKITAFRKYDGVKEIDIEWLPVNFVEKKGFQNIIIKHAYGNFNICINWELLPENFIFRKYPDKKYELSDKTYNLDINYNAKKDTGKIYPLKNYSVKFDVFSKAVKELYIKDYREENNYVLSIIRKTIDINDIRIVEIDINGNNVQVFNLVSSNPKGVELINANNVYILVDWDKIPLNTNEQDYPKKIYQIDESVKNIELSPYIFAKLNDDNIDLSNLVTKTELNNDYYNKNNSDSRYQTIGNSSSTNYKFQDARDFNVLPSNTGSQNVINLQNALNGGNKTLTISTPGTYLIDNTIYIDDNTEILIGKGVIFKKETNHKFSFANRHINNRSLRNKNITIKGMDFDCNMKQVVDLTNYDDVNFGLVGHFAFWKIDNLLIEDFKCYNYDHYQFGLQVCNFNNFIINNFYFNGLKDGIHLGGNSRKAVIQNGNFTCYDDSIALNCFDYPASNPEIGDIEDVFVDNIVDNFNSEWDYGSRFTLLLVGRPVRWQENIKICQGDAVVNNGYTYIAVTERHDGVEVTSTTEPSANWGDSQLTSEGIRWIKKADYEVTSATIKNVEYRNIHHNYPKEGVLCHVLIDQYKTWSRSLHPLVPENEYPIIENVVFNNLDSDYGTFWFMDKSTFDITVNNLNRRTSGGNYFVRSFEVMENSVFTLNNCYIPNTDKIESVKNLKTTINNKINNGNLVVNNYTGRLYSNSPVSVDINNINIPLNGDIINIDGILNLRKNNTWVQL